MYEYEHEQNHALVQWTSVTLTCGDWWATVSRNNSTSIRTDVGAQAPAQFARADQTLEIWGNGKEQ